MNPSTRKKLASRARQAPRILVVEKDSVLLHFNIEVLVQPGCGVKSAAQAKTARKEHQAMHSNRAKSMSARPNCL